MDHYAKDQYGFRNCNDSNGDTWPSSYVQDYGKWAHDYQTMPQSSIKQEYHQYSSSCAYKPDYQEEVKFFEHCTTVTSGNSSSLTQLQMLTNQHCATTTVECDSTKNIPPIRARGKGKASSAGEKQQVEQVATRKQATLRPHSTPATLMWLENNYELAEGVCIPRSVLYLHYVDFCNVNRVQPVNAASFGKIIRQQFPHLTTRRLGTRGQSRYHYYGIAIKEDSSYYQMSYSKKSVQIQSNNGNIATSMVPDRKYKPTYTGSKQQTKPTTSPGFAKSKIEMLDNSTSVSYYYGKCESTSETCRKEAKSETAEVNSNQVVTEEEGLKSNAASSSAVTGLIPNSFVPVLPPFPTTDELHISYSSHNNLVSTFLLMYRAHCQRILDAIVRANFDEVHTLIHHFWQQIPHHLTAVLSSNLLINLLAICDIRLYRTIVKLILVTLSQPISELVHSQLEEFASSFESIVSSALHQENITLRQVKTDVSRQFSDLVKCLLRHCRLYHSIQSDTCAYQTVLRQLYLDWSRLDIDTLTTTIIDLYGKFCLPTGCNLASVQLQKMLHKYLTELKSLLANMSDCSQLLEYFENIWLVSFEAHRSDRLESMKGHGGGLYTADQYSSAFTSGNLEIVRDFVQTFLSLWTLAQGQLVKELARRKNYSKDLFLKFSGLFEEFCIYKVKDLYLDECMQIFFTNAGQNCKPILPEPIEPIDFMKRFASYTESDEWCWNRCEASTGEESAINYGCYQESSQAFVYGNHLVDHYEGYEGYEHRQPPPPPQPPRQDSLICFSMNFHANSIQVMTTPSTPPNQETGSADHYRHYYGQNNNNNSSTNGGSKSLCCYLADGCQNSCFNL